MNGRRRGMDRLTPVRKVIDKANEMTGKAKVKPKLVAVKVGDAA